MTPADRKPIRARAVPAPAVVRRRSDALARANEVRSARATLKNELAGSRIRIEDVLAHPAAFARNARVSDLMLSVPGYGPARAARALLRCRIPYEKTVAGLSDRQRSALIQLLFTARPAALAP